MSKRFTDTNKWDQAWFRKLKPKMKCAWAYLVDRCDHAGVLEVDLETMSFMVGEAISLEEIHVAFSNQIEFLSDEKLIIRAFIEFQYGELNPENRVHKSVLSRLEKVGPNKALTSPLKRAKDKDKDKDKDLDKEKDKESIGKKIEKIYSDLYPLKKGKTKGVEKLSKEIKTDEDLENLKLAIANYSKTINDPKYIKHFSTFATEWRDWVDSNAGKATVTQSKVSAVFDVARDQLRRIEAGEL